MLVTENHLFFINLATSQISIYYVFWRTADCQTWGWNKFSRADIDKNISPGRGFMFCVYVESAVAAMSAIFPLSSTW